MEPDPHENNNGEDGSEPDLKLKISELKHKLIVERGRFGLLQSQSEISMLVATQEVDRCKRGCMCLKERAARLEQDRDILRERELKDQERVKSLLEKIEKNEKEFTEKMVALKMENWELECAKTRLEEEICNLKERAKEEMEAQILTGIKENIHVVEKVKGVQIQNSDDGDGDRVPISQLSKKRAAEVNEKDSGTSDELAETQIPLALENNTKEKNNKSARPMKKFKHSDSGRSSAAGNPRSTDCDDVLDKGVGASITGVHRSIKRTKNQCNQRAYKGRIASPEQKRHAQERAQTLRTNLEPCNPSFIKPMVHSHVAGSFWINLPKEFCKENLPADDLKMILQDEKGLEYEVKYIGYQYALSGGWKGFAVAHNLEIGDTLIFEMCEPEWFKVYIIKAIPDESSEDFDEKIAGGYTDGTNKQGNTNVTENQAVDFKINLQKTGTQCKVEETHD